MVQGSAGILGRFVGWLKERFDDSPAAVALDRVQDAPDSPSRLQELAEVVDRRAAAEPGFRNDLERLVQEAQAGGVDVGSIAQSVWGSQNVQSAGIVDSAIIVTYGQPPRQPGP